MSWKAFEKVPCDVKLKWISPVIAATADVKREFFVQMDYDATDLLVCLELSR